MTLTSVRELLQYLVALCDMNTFSGYPSIVQDFRSFYPETRVLEPLSEFHLEGSIVCCVLLKIHKKNCICII